MHQPFVICIDYYWFCSMQVAILPLTCKKDSYEFIISYWIVALHGRQLAWKICNQLTRLLNHSPNVGIRCIHFHYKRLTKNRDTKDLRTHEHGLEAVKCRLLDRRPAPNLTFSKKVQQGVSNTCEIVHILAIVVAQAKELLYILVTGRCEPFMNGHQLGRVQVDLAMANYVAQVIDLALKKCTFLHLCT